VKMSTAFPSKYLRAEDLDGRDITVRIDRVQMEEVGEEKKEKPIIYFEGKSKGLVLNVTNARTISAIYGDNSDDWRGREILLFEAQVSYQGKTTAAIRVRVPKRKREPEKVEASASKSTAETIDDDIPF
jgi:hypothetical protein